MNATPLQKLLTIIGDCKRSDNGFKALCPAHQDDKPSLSITETESGAVLLKCGKGCSLQNILDRLGLTLRDLFPGNGVDHAAQEKPVAKKALITPVIVSLADVQAERVKWVWSGRIPIGKVTLMAGDPGLGKSLITSDLAARVSSGAPWPDSPTIKMSAGGVVLLSAEDDIADTIRPRLEAAGADLRRIIALPAVRRNYTDDPEKESTFSLETDLEALEAAILKVRDCRLIIIDPITAYLGGTDSHKNADIRGLLAPLAALAAKHRVAVVCVTHLNKSAGGSAIYRAIGSIAFAAMARVVWAVTKDRENPRHRLMLPAKNNLAQDTLGLAYTIEPYGPDGAPVVTWEPDPVNLSADDAMQADTGKDDREDGNQAQAWLREALKDGPLSAADVVPQGKANGFTQRHLRNALKALGGTSRKSSFGGGWVWSIPSGEDAVPPDGESSASSQKTVESSSLGGSQDHEDSQDSRKEGTAPRQETSAEDDTEWGVVA